MAQPVVNRAARGETERDEARAVRLLTFNIQSGITTTKYRDYVTNYWRHVLPHENRARNLQRIGDLIADYDVVALQEIDAGSLRSGFVNQVEYLAQRAGFPYWYAQRNRDFGPFAQMGNGVLSHLRPRGLEDHKLPGAIPGRGALTLTLPFAESELLVVILHLSLGGRSQEQQLEYVRELIRHHDHVVVLGDLNTSLRSVLNDSALSGCGLRSHPRPVPTFPSWAPRQIIDHALVSEGLALDGYDVLDCCVSDHRPLAVTVSLR
ncbi:MAG: endonuclease/exonuclease/phosphatase family protein [Pseudomonadota bacterium]